MYFCTVNVNSMLMICTSSSAHWQQASKLSALQRFELIWKDWDKCTYQYNINILYHGNETCSVKSADNMCGISSFVGKYFLRFLSSWLLDKGSQSSELSADSLISMDVTVMFIFQVYNFYKNCFLGQVNFMSKSDFHCCFFYRIFA